MGAFDGELYLLGFRSAIPASPKKKKITHNFYGPLTCYIARVSRGGSCGTDGYIIGISKKDISQANADEEWPNAVKKSSYFTRYISSYKDEYERVVIDSASFQEIYKNFKKHGKSYAFINLYSFDAIKLENLDRKYK